MVSLTIPILKVHFFDNFAHRKDICRGAKDIHAHPSISGIQCGECFRSFCSLPAGTTVKSMLDIRPCSNYRAKNHEPEREERRGSDAATEPEHFAVCDDNDGQVLEDSVDGDRKELKSFGAGIDHSYE